MKSLERKGEDASIHIADLGRFLQLGLSGAQDPTRSMATTPGTQTLAAGLWGQPAGSANGSGSSGAAAGGLLCVGQRSFHRFGSDARLGSAGESLDGEIEIAGSRERESGAARERDVQGSRHRERRR